MSDAKKPEKQPTFEEALGELEAVLAKLERSDCPLEEALELFQDGMKLVGLCRSKLAAAEDKISILLKDSGEFVPFTGKGEKA
jgi:exodeoxyribonuclease VII small subunit